jgi:hypothetical protein
MLFCLTVNYTLKALDAMAKNPNTNRREAVEKLVTAAARHASGHQAFHRTTIHNCMVPSRPTGRLAW